MFLEGNLAADTDSYRTHHGLGKQENAVTQEVAQAALGRDGGCMARVSSPGPDRLGCPHLNPVK